MPDPGSPWERANPSDGFGYLPWPVRTRADRARWNEASSIAHHDTQGAGWQNRQEDDTVLTDTDREYNYKWWGIAFGLGFVFWGSVAAAWLA